MSRCREDVAVIIPALEGTVDPLLAALQEQTITPGEVKVVRGVRPNGRARNVGVAATSAPWLIFIDDDALPGHPELLERLLVALQADETLGAVGSAKLLPPGAPWFQRWVAREVPRVVHPVVAQPLETNPEPQNHYYCEITTTCCAMARDVWAAVGGFDDTLVRGVDTEFFVRLRRRGYRLLLAAHTWVYHPAPASLAALLRKQFLYGLGHAQEVRRDPSRDPARAFRSRWTAAGYLALRLAFLLPNVFLPYSYAEPRWRLGCKPLKAIASLASALGYVHGWYNAS
ncbi:MAG: glycosyltransferase [Anaerolineae bacterium]